MGAREQRLPASPPTFLHSLGQDCSACCGMALVGQRGPGWTQVGLSLVGGAAVHELRRSWATLSDTISVGKGPASFLRSKHSLSALR